MNMFLIIYFVFNVIIQFDAFHIEDVEFENGTEFYEMANIILELHAKYCDYIPLCTINVSAYNNQTYDRRKWDCCQPCSCKPDCKLSHTCCPDYWIHDVIPDARFADSVNPLDMLRNKSVEDALKVSPAVDTTYIRDREQTKKCLSSRLITNSRTRKVVVNDDAYIMVTKCPGDYGKRNKKEYLIREFCERLVDIDNADSASKDQLIPITSTTSLVTYKNVYCLECNEGTRKGNYWSSWFGCNNIEATQTLMHPLENIFLSVRHVPYCNIKFQPPKLMDELSLRKCNFIHVSKCSEDWILNVNDTNMVTMYENACKHFFNPVLGEFQKKVVIFNNIACRQCNPMDYDKDCFASTSKEEYDWIELNTDALLRISERMSPADQIPLDIRTDNSTLCNKGFIFDSVDNICRMIYCPGNFINVDGQCVPSILETGCNYSVKFVVIPSGKLSLNNQSEMDELERTLSKLVNNFLQGEFTAYAIKIWRQFVNDKLHNHLILVQFRNDNAPYVDTLDVVQRLLRTLSTFTVQLSNRRIPITTSFLKYDVFSMNKIWRDIYNVSDTLDRKKRRSLKLVYEMGTRNFLSRYRFKISRTHLCSRLLLAQKEIHVLGKALAKIVRTNIILQGTDFDISNDGQEVYVCIKDFLNIDAQVGPRIWNSTVSTKDIQRTTKKDDTVIFVSLTVLGVGVYVLSTVIGVLFKYVMKRNCRDR